MRYSPRCEGNVGTCGVMIRKIVIAITVIVLVVALYLTIPSQWPTSTSSQPEPPIALEANERCQSGKIYVAEDTREVHEREGYEFIVDNNCADLQHQLILAIGNDDINEVRRLISLGANPDTSDWANYQADRPFMVAIYHDTAIVKVLLDNGAKVNEEYCCCAACRSPLTAAIDAEKVETAQFLVERGANLAYRPSWGDTDELRSALEIALRSKNPQINHLADNVCEPVLSCRIKLRTKKALSLLHIPNEWLQP